MSKIKEIILEPANVKTGSNFKLKIKPASEIQQKGTYLTFNNSKANQVTIRPEGHSEQDSYSGYSLYDFINNNYTKEGTVTVTKLDNGYTFSNATAGTRILFSSVNVDSSKNYVVSFEVVNSSGGYIELGWAGSRKMVSTTKTNGKVTGVLTGITTSVFSIYVPTTTITITNLMVYEGDDITKPYEPYVRWNTKS